MFVQLTKDCLGKSAGARIEVDHDDADRLVSLGWARADDESEPAGHKGLDDRIDRAMQTFLRRQLDQRRIDARQNDQRPFSGRFDSPAADLWAPSTSLAHGIEGKAGFSNFGEFAQAVRDACQPGKRPDDRLTAVTKSALGMGENVGADGGFLIPTEFSKKLLERVYSPNNLLGMTDSYTVSSNVVAFPRSAETSRANGSRWGGVRAYWRDEGEQATATKPTFGRLQLTLRKLFVLIHATDELLSDAGGQALEQYLFRVASEEIDFVVSDAILNGTGIGQPMGILNSGALVTVAKETGQVAATVTANNLTAMWARMWSPCRSNAVWLINQDVESQLHTLTIGSGGALAYMPAGGLSGKPYATLFGRPVMPVEWCSTLGAVGDVVLADLRHYVTITKGLVESAMSIHLRFDYDESTFRFIFRVDGCPWWTAPLTPYKGSATQSCFVTLAARP